MKVVCISKGSLQNRGYDTFREWNRDPEHIYIGKRVSRLGIKESIWFNKNLNNDDYYSYIKNSKLHIDSLNQLKVKELGCWCKGDDIDNCHGNILIRIINEINDVDIITKDIEGISISSKRIKRENVIKEDKIIDNICIKTEKISINNERVDPNKELSDEISKIYNMDIDDNIKSMKIDNVRNCYAYRIWLWNNYNLTFDEEMNRVTEIIEKKYDV